MLKQITLFLLLSILILTPGCVQKSSTIQIIAKEWVLESNHASSSSEIITFELINQGRATHEMVVNLSGHSVGEIKNVAPGDSGTITLKLLPGHYLLTCNIPGHREAGMVTKFIVTS